MFRPTPGNIAVISKANTQLVDVAKRLTAIAERIENEEQADQIFDLIEKIADISSQISVEVGKVVGAKIEAA